LGWLLENNYDLTPDDPIYTKIFPEAVGGYDEYLLSLLHDE